MVDAALLSEYFPFWQALGVRDRESLRQAARRQPLPRDTMLHGGGGDCSGLHAVLSGRLRAYMLSESGREITLSRLLPRDICLFSASCVIRDLQFDICVAAEQDSETLLLPSPDYQELARRSLAVADFTNRIMASRFSEVMWLMEQVLFRSFDTRLAAFLLEQSGVEGADTLRITHEQIARHLGSAREVVTRMLQYFQSEGLVVLSRGQIVLTDRGALSRRTQG